MYNFHLLFYRKFNSKSILVILICSFILNNIAFSNSVNFSKKSIEHSINEEYTADVSITRLSSETFYINDDVNPEKKGQYALYEIKNIGTTTLDAYANINNFVGDIRLSDAEEDSYYVGQLAPNETSHVFFYLGTDVTLSGQNGSTSNSTEHTINVYDGSPDQGGTFIHSEKFEINLIQDVIKANSNKVLGVTINGTPALGNTFSITVNGETGTIGSAKIVNFSAATNIAWPANAFKLTHSIVNFTKVGNGNNNNDGLSFENDLNFQILDTKNTAYEITYTFLVVEATSEISGYEPTVYISSGNQIKHSVISSGIEVPKIPASGSTLSGFVWSDDDFDGIKQEEESKMNGVKVLLLDSLGNQLESTTTSGTIGDFEFTGITSGNYQIKFDRNDRFVATKQNQTIDDALDSDMNRASRIIELTVTSGIDISNISAGFTPDFDRDLIPDIVENNGPTPHDAVDPAGYFYDEANGESISGGMITVSGPGMINIVDDGSLTGYYSWLIDGTAGVYTMTIIPPGGYEASSTRNPSSTLDPTGFTPDPYSIGSGDTDEDGFIDDFSDVANPFYLTFELESGDPFVINNNIPLQAIALPVEISSFKASGRDCSVELVWSTESEENFDHFEIQRSEEGYDFESISNISSLNTNGDQQTTSYSYTDAVTSSSNYYRLKMIDLDGSYEYSDIIEIETDCDHFNQIINVFPNPIGPDIRELSISIESKIPKNVNISIINSQGGVNKRLNLYFESGKNEINCDISGLTAGIYFIVFEDESGEKRSVKFIKNS